MRISNLIYWLRLRALCALRVKRRSVPSLLLRKPRSVSLPRFAEGRGKFDRGNFSREM